MSDDDEKLLPPGFIWDPELISAYLDMDTTAYPSKEAQQKCADEVIERAWELYRKITAEVCQERDAAIAKLKQLETQLNHKSEGVAIQDLIDWLSWSAGGWDEGSETQRVILDIVEQLENGDLHTWIGNMDGMRKSQ